RIFSQQLTTNLSQLATPISFGLSVLTKDGRRVTQPQGAGAFGKECLSRASNTGCDIWSEGEQTPINVHKSKGSLSFRFAHSLLEERIVIDCGSHNFLVGPAGKDIHGRRLDESPRPGLTRRVIAKTAGNFGKRFRHRNKSQNKTRRQFESGSGFREPLVMNPFRRASESQP